MARPKTLARTLAAFVSKARRGERAVDVEDLLAFVSFGDAAVVSTLRSAATGWSRAGRLAPGDGPRVVPLGRWTDHVCALLEGGCGAVVALARSPEERRRDLEDGGPDAGIALGVLKEVRSLDAVRSVLALASDACADLATRRSLAVGCAAALNELTWFDPRVEVPEPEAGDARDLLHALLSLELSAAEIGTVCCALRGVGNEASLRLVSSLAAPPPPWQNAPSDARRAITKRLRERGP